MESTLRPLSASTAPIFQFSSKYASSRSGVLVAQLHCGIPAAARPSQLASLQLSRSGPGSCFRSPGLHRKRFKFSVKSDSGGGGFGGIDGGSGGGGGGGDGAAGGDEAKPTAVPGSADELALSSDVIVLGVGGMTCGGCAESVRKILESQPQVSSAIVNLETETAVVWPVPEAKAALNWRKDIGEALAKHLTNCGFTSHLKDQEVTEGEIQS
ncbi:copper-transporting ATPase PAA1, chloroplastic-like [Andrographis paniculata]|uniref:copper-transporting ATPase PAA1, chloroplastic-like n=1 Tax=Andrographis paniculata TaxID=175694 RepID=UPI0021E78BF4|nr:copper-transporting ATPase PAA1, chloroplastic-like [Andrographis paniculata]